MGSQARDGTGWGSAVYRRRVLPLSLVLACLLNARSLALGLLADDHTHRQFILRQLAGAPGAFWDMFDLGGRGGALDVQARVFAGLLPWWSAPDLKVAFFRPLSVASQFLDHILWPDWPAFMHAHNLVIYGLLIVVVAYLYGRLASSGLAAASGLLLYALDDAHTASVLWIAGRNTLLTALFSAATLLFHVRARVSGERSVRVLAPLCLALALASSEGGVAVWGYLVGHACWLDREPVRARLRALVPMASVTVVHFMIYALLGYGTRASGVYRSPFGDPGLYLAGLPVRLPAAVSEQFAIPGAMGVWLSSADAQQLGVVLSGILALAIVAGAFVLARRAPVVRVWLLGTLVSLLAICAFGPAPRLLLLSGVGAFGLLGELLARLFARRRAGWLLASPVLVVHALLIPPLAQLHMDQAHALDDVYRRAGAQLPAETFVPGSVLLVLNSPSFLVSAMEPAYRDPGVPFVPTFILGVTRGRVQIERPDPQTLRVSTADGYLREPSSLLVRAPGRPFARGDRVQVGALLVTVEEVTQDGRPRRVRLQATVLDHPAWHWVAWSGDGYRPVTLPGVGQRRTLPRGDLGLPW